MRSLFRFAVLAQLVFVTVVLFVNDATAIINWEWEQAVDSNLPFQPILAHIISPREAISLGGVWQTVRSSKPDSDAPPGKGASWQAVLVPGQHYIDLFRGAAGRRVWFRRSFEVPQRWSRKRTWLYLERVANTGRIYVNGRFIGEVKDGHWPHEVDITEALRFGATNDLAIGVLFPQDSTALAARQPVGWSWFYPIFAGLPYPVHIEQRDQVSVEDVYIRPRLQGGPGLRDQAAVPVGSKLADRVWMMGALGRITSGYDNVAQVQWLYSDGSQGTSTIQAGVHTNGYQYYHQMLRQGRLAWTGDNGQRQGVVIYVWELTNPHPQRPIKHIRVNIQGSHELALVGMTLEQVTRE